MTASATTAWYSLSAFTVTRIRCVCHTTVNRRAMTNIAFLVRETRRYTPVASTDQARRTINIWRFTLAPGSIRVTITAGKRALGRAVLISLGSRV